MTSDIGIGIKLFEENAANQLVCRNANKKRVRIVNRASSIPPYPEEQRVYNRAE